LQGAGKSSLTAAIFRLTGLSGGTICIDGIDLAGIPLHDVRGRAASLMAQTNVLFSGTVRCDLLLDWHTALDSVIGYTEAILALLQWIPQLLLRLSNAYRSNKACALTPKMD
jgi:ABC-type multidrug transport system fused ATPase/permease subunit